MAWSRKSAMFASLSIAMYLLGLVLRNQQLVTVAVVLLSFHDLGRSKNHPWGRGLHWKKN